MHSKKTTLFEDNSSPVALGQNLYEMRGRKIGTNCVIEAYNPATKESICKDVHAIVIAPSSGYCKEHINFDMPCHHVHRVVMEFTGSENVLEEIIKFMYTGKCLVFEELVEDMIQLSRILKLCPGLENFCFEFLVSNLKTEEMCKKLIGLASQFSREDYVDEARKQMISFRKESSPGRRKTGIEILLKRAANFFANEFKNQAYDQDYFVLKVIVALQETKIENFEIRPNVASRMCNMIENKLKNFTLEEIFLVIKLRGTYLGVKESPRISDFIAKNFDVIVQSYHFLGISSKEIIFFMNSPGLRLISDEKKLKALVKWVTNIEADHERLSVVMYAAFGVLNNSEVFKTTQHTKFLEDIEAESMTCDFLLNEVLTRLSTRTDINAEKFVSRAIFYRIIDGASDLTTRNCFAIRGLAKPYSFPDFQKFKLKICLFISNNLQELAKSDDFLDLEGDEIVCIFASPDVPQSFEEEKFELCVKWIKSKEGRVKWFPDLLKTIKTWRLSRESVSYIASHPLVRMGDALQNSLESQLSQQEISDDAATTGNESDCASHDSYPVTSIRIGNTEDNAETLSKQDSDIEQDRDSESALSHASSRETIDTDFSFRTVSFSSGQFPPSEIDTSRDGFGLSSGYDTKTT